MARRTFDLALTDAAGLCDGSASYSTIWRAIVDGKLPAQRKGAQWFVNAGDVRRFARERELAVA